MTTNSDTTDVLMLSLDRTQVLSRVFIAVQCSVSHAKAQFTSAWQDCTKAGWILQQGLKNMVLALERLNVELDIKIILPYLP